MIGSHLVRICEHSRAEVELPLERWRDTFESHGLRVSRGKTEYMPCPERDQTIYIQEKEVKDKVYKTAIKPAMVYGAECWAVRKKEERKLHATEMRMLRWARGKTRLDHVRNVDIWKEAHMYPMAEFLREKRLRWFGHVQRRDKDDATRKILQMTVDGKRNRGRPKLRWRDLVKDDMARNQMTTEMAEDRRHWHVMIRADTLRSVGLQADR